PLATSLIFPLSLHDALPIYSNLFHAPFYGRALTTAFDDGGVVLVDDNLFCRAEILNLEVLQFDTEVFGNRTAFGEGCDIVQHRLDRKSTRLNSSHVAISYAV